MRIKVVEGWFAVAGTSLCMPLWLGVCGELALLTHFIHCCMRMKVVEGWFAFARQAFVCRCGLELVGNSRKCCM